MSSARGVEGATYFAQYTGYHRDRRNLLCHKIGIPLIVWSIFALLELVRLGPVNLAMIAGIAVLIFYFRIDVRLAMVALVAFAALYVAGMFTPWPVAVAAFIVGWVFQFVGHAYEGNRPAFLTNLVHLLVGPLWICSELTGLHRT